MNIDIKELLKKNINNALIGREKWLEIVEKYDLGNRDYVILMPSTNKEYNFNSLLYIDQFAKKNNTNKIVILTYDEGVKKSAHLFSNSISNVIHFSRDEAEQLMQFYCLYMFTDKLIIASLEEPEGRNGIQLIGKKGITVEELIAIGVYGLNEFKKEFPPIYEGDDKIIKSFMNF